MTSLLIGYVVGVVFFSLLGGYLSRFPFFQDCDEDPMQIIFVALTWPFILSILIIGGILLGIPFGLIYLGKTISIKPKKKG